MPVNLGHVFGCFLDQDCKSRITLFFGMKSFLTIILASLVFYSCVSSSSNSEKAEKKPGPRIELDSICTLTRDSFLRMNSIEKHCQQMGLDSVLVEYYGTDIYDIKFSGGKMTIKGGLDHFEKEVFDLDSLNKFISVIDAFFVTKNESVEISRKKTGNLIAAEYPHMFISIYMKNGSTIKEIVKIGDGMYEIEYNPLFLEFYEFVDNLKPTISSSKIHLRTIRQLSGVAEF